MRSPAEVERELEELMRTRLERRPSFVWSALADATGDLASSRLLPWIEEACKEGLVDESAVTLEEIRSDVRLGRKAVLEAHRRRGKDRLVDDVAAARSTRSAAHREGGHSLMLPALQVALRIAAHFGGEKLVALQGLRIEPAQAGDAAGSLDIDSNEIPGFARNGASVSESLPEDRGRQ